MKKITTLLLILFSSITMYGQNGSIKGKVISKQNIPIPNINIKIDASNKGTMTNAKGAYEIKNIKVGTHVLKISSVGYASQEIEIEVIENQTTNVANIVLQEKTEQLQEVEVEGQKNKYVIKEPSTSLRLKTEIAKLPQNIQVISSELLKDQQATNILDGVVRNVSGVSMIEHWGHFASINMRGFRLPAFRNGVNVQDSWGPLSEDMNTVDRIEFVKGPAGFMMSAGEPGGFYNVVTKKPTAIPIAQISLSAGSFDSYRATVDLGGKLTENGKLLFRLNGMYQTTDSHRGNEDAVRYGLAPALTYNFSDRTSITTELNLQNAEAYIGTAYVFAPVADGYGSLDRNFKFTDPNYPVTDIEELTFFTNFKHEFSDNWSFETQFAYLRYNQEGNSTWLWNFEDNGDATRYVSIWDALSLGKYFQTYIYGNFNTGGITHNILGGFDYSQKEYWPDWSSALEVLDTTAPFNIYNPTYGNVIAPEFDRSVNVRERVGDSYNGFTTKSYYFQDEIGFLENKIRLTLAGRYTELNMIGKEENDEKITPRAGLSVDILPTLTAYALYDQSFLGQNGASFTGDVFDPVEAIDIEGGIKKSFFDGRLKTTLGAYLITKENILVADPENSNFSIQLGEVQSKGIEFDLQGEITPELSLILNYANTNVEITEDTDSAKIGTKIAGHAKHMTNAWLNYNFNERSALKGFGASLGYQYQIERSSWSWNADNESALPDYFRLDGALSWSKDKIRVQLNVNNILDEYLFSGSNFSNYLYWQSEPGINGRVTVTYSF